MSISDPGLQAERTALAWARTSLALVANAMLVLRAGAIQRQRLLLALGALLLLLAAAGIAFSAWRRRRLESSRRLEGPPPAALLVTVAVTWLVCTIQMLDIAVRGATRLLSTFSLQ